MPPRLATRTWGRATALFAVGQAGAAYAMAALYAHHAGPLIFRIGGATLLAAALLLLVSGLLARR